jgi:hypothetical protein
MVGARKYILLPEPQVHETAAAKGSATTPPNIRGPNTDLKMQRAIRTKYAACGAQSRTQTWGC